MTDIAKSESGAIALGEKSLEWQMQMMTQKFRLPPTMCETHRIEKRGEKFALVKRSRPIRIYDDGEGVKAFGTPAPSARSVGGKPSFAEAHRGKYNDEGRLTLVNPMGASLETKEVAAIAQM